MRHKLTYLLISLLALTSCDIDIDWNDYNDPYDQYSGRMIERIRIGNDYIYYDYDRRGRIIAIEDTYFQNTDFFTYGENKDGDEIITVGSTIGTDRDIILDWSGSAETEIAYEGGFEYQAIEYDYLNNRLWKIDVEEYNDDGSIFSEERYDLKFDRHDNLCSIERRYDEEDGYWVDSELTFSSFTNIENDYNVDILSIIDLYIDDDFASHIGRTGKRSKYLPTRAVLEVNRNGKRNEDIEYRIDYMVNGNHISSILVSSSNGIDMRYDLSYKAN